MKMAMWSNRITNSNRRSIRHCASEPVAIFRAVKPTSAFSQDLVRSPQSQAKCRVLPKNRRPLQPLPTTALAPCQEMRVTVSQFSTIQVKANVYSVPSRLIGTSLLVRLRAETLEGYVGSTVAFTIPRLIGKQQHRIDYRHVIWSLVRKPGAFAAYRYRDDLFPTTTFRLAYDRLVTSGVETG